MKQQKNSFFIYIMLIQFCSLWSSHEFHQACNNNMPYMEMNFNRHQDTRYVAMQVNDYNAQPLSNCHFLENFISIPDYSNKQPANYSVIVREASPKLRNYFNTVVFPLIYNAMIKNHYVAIPGYTFPDGLRHCRRQLSQFSHSDAALIANMTKRLETYCTFIESILFNGKNHSFCDTISYKNQVKLILAYADFLKEFYAEAAPYIFDKQSQENPLMQQVRPSIQWGHYNGNNIKSSSKKIEQQYAASLNGNLGAMYKALQTGEIEKAYVVGQQRVQTVISGRCFGKTEHIVSVFENYPNLKKIVEQRYFADQAKMAQELAAKQMAMQEQFVEWKNDYAVDRAKIPVISDALLQRYHAIDREKIVTFHKQFHKVSSQQAAYINSECLTADKKGILFDGCYVQHQLVNEAVSVIDTAISCDLVGNVQDAVVDLANASLVSNKYGDIITASRTLDACWAIIDFGKKAVGYAYTTVTTHAPLIAQGMYDGLGESLHGAVHAVCHPIATAKDVRDSFVTAGYYLGKAVYAIAEHSTVCDMMEANPECAEQMIREQSCDPAVFFAVYENAKNISTQDVARVGTKTVVDMMLLHGATKIVSSIAKEAVSVFVSCMRKGAQSVETAVTAAGIPVRCAEEISSLMENIQPVGGSAITKVVTESRLLIEDMVKNLMTELAPEIAVLREKFACVQYCIPDCIKKGFAEFAGKHIKIPYEHIFGIELAWNDAKNIVSRISGFHHDFMGAIEKSGVFKFVRKSVEKNGCYKADICIGEKCISEKTFFPQHWSREEVISKIYEAYENVIKEGFIPLEKGGKYMIEGSTQEGIIIRMFMTKNGQITTAYPVVQMGA